MTPFPCALLPSILVYHPHVDVVCKKTSFALAYNAYFSRKSRQTDESMSFCLAKSICQPCLGHRLKNLFSVFGEGISCTLSPTHYWNLIDNNMQYTVIQLGVETTCSNF